MDKLQLNITTREEVGSKVINKVNGRIASIESSTRGGNTRIRYFDEKGISHRTVTRFKDHIVTIYKRKIGTTVTTVMLNRRDAVEDKDIDIIDLKLIPK